MRGVRASAAERARGGSAAVLGGVGRAMMNGQVGIGIHLRVFALSFINIQVYVWRIPVWSLSVARIDPKIPNDQLVTLG